MKEYCQKCGHEIKDGKCKCADIVPDMVNHPPHYTTGKFEVIDFIEDKELGFHLGNAVKYIVRAGKKDVNAEIQDLEKASWYLERQIVNLKMKRSANNA